MQLPHKIHVVTCLFVIVDSLFLIVPKFIITNNHSKFVDEVAIKFSSSQSVRFYLDHIKRQSVFDHVQNMQIQIIMLEVPSGPLLSIHIFCNM